MDPLDLLSIGMSPTGGDAGALGGGSVLDMFKRPQMSPEQMRRAQAIQGIAGTLDAPAQQPVAAPQPAGAAPARMPLQAPQQPTPLPVQNQFAAPPRQPRPGGGMMALGTTYGGYSPLPSSRDVMQSVNAAMLGAMDRGNYGHAAQMGALGSDWARRMGL